MHPLLLGADHRHRRVVGAADLGVRVDEGAAALTGLVPLLEGVEDRGDPVDGVPGRVVEPEPGTPASGSPGAGGRARRARPWSRSSRRASSSSCPPPRRSGRRRPRGCRGRRTAPRRRRAVGGRPGSGPARTRSPRWRGGGRHGRSSFDSTASIPTGMVTSPHGAPSALSRRRSRRRPGVGRRLELRLHRRRARDPRRVGLDPAGLAVRRGGGRAGPVRRLDATAVAAAGPGDTPRSGCCARRRTSAASWAASVSASHPVPRR